MSNFDIHASFSDLGIKKDDIVMIHCDAGVAAQYSDIPLDKRLDYLINSIKDFFSDVGTILVPTFTYSSTKNEVYNVQETESSVGLFSERFRHGADVKRSNHPIFSVCTWGKLADHFLKGSNQDCFGAGSFFDLVLDSNVKLVTLGCDLSRITFVHYVEQKKLVSYRYFKNFKGKVVDNGKEQDVMTNYFVRDTGLKSACNLSLFAKAAKKNKLLRSGAAGRFPIEVISSSDFLKTANDLLAINHYSLIDEGCQNDEI